MCVPVRYRWTTNCHFTFYSFLFSPPNQTNHHSLTSPPSENLPSVCLESISRPLILCKLPPLSCQGSALAQPTSVSSSSFLFLLHYGINGTVCVLQVYFGRTESSMSGLVWGGNQEWNFAAWKGHGCKELRPYCLLARVCVCAFCLGGTWGCLSLTKPVCRILNIAMLG